MASRQKSFFEQNNKSRPQWHGSKKSNLAPRAVEQDPKPPAVLPPIPASSASRSKLKAFHFHKQAEQPNTKDLESALSDEEQEIGKENNAPLEDQSIMAASQLMPGPPPLSQRSQHKECPQTPVGRLPLAELIAAVDDNANQNLDSTPVERVLWHHVPGSSQFSSSQPASTSKQGRKRARSSSPLSSSQNEASSHFPSKKQSFDLQTLQKTLKTPQADPAGDLWARYALKTGGVRDGSPTRNETNFTELLRSSSPQTPGSHLKTRELGGLRRAISCANEWPTSAAKRRRLNHSGSQNQALNDKHTVERSENAKMSRVSLLVEQVQNALLRSRTGDVKEKQNLESSPSPDKGTSFHQSQPSPSNGAHGHDRQKQAPPNLEHSNAIAEAELQVAQNECSHGLERGSEFEDDDFDDDDFDDDELLEVVHASLAPKQPIDTHVVNKARTAPSKQTLVETGSAYPKSSVPPKIKSEYAINKSKSGRLNTSAGKVEAPDISKAPSSLHDDFEDDDDDMSAADIENLVAVYDRQPRSPPRRGQKSSLPQESTRKPLAELDGANKSISVTETHIAPKKKNIIEVSSDEEFGEGADFDDIVAQCTAASQPAAQNVSVLVEGGYVTENGRPHPEKVLLVQPERTKVSKAITLRESWVRSPCLPGSYVHLVGNFDDTGQCIIDDHHNMLILHPDHLVSATVVGDSFSCTRRAVLQDRVKATNDSSEAQVYGHILHEIFQGAMKANRWDDGWLHQVTETTASRYLESFFEINVDPIRAVEQLKCKTTALQSWAEVFVSATPKSEAVIKDRNGAISNLSVNKLLEVEEKVWSPMYGLKGNVDASIQITTNDGSGEKVLTVPFELKTGRHANAAHKAQTALYTLLLSDRYGSYFTGET
ncbi:MAG: hypothetical protein Q9225_001053 [Loekoesia sp. 1 TL-2023]